MAEPQASPQMTPEQWAQLQQQQQAQMNDYINQIKSTFAAKQEAGPQLEYNPIRKKYIDAQGNEVQAVKNAAGDLVAPEGATQRNELAPEYQMAGGQSYLEKALAKQGMEEVSAKDQAALNAAQAQAQMRSQMASRGGFRSGNAQLAGRQSMRDLLMAKQQVGQQGAMTRADIGLKGTEMDREAQGYNIKNLFTQGENVNKFNLDKYRQQMNVEAAKKQADATRAAGNSGGGGFLGSYICGMLLECGLINLEDYCSLGELMKYVKENEKEALLFYKENAPKAVTKAKEQNLNCAEEALFLLINVIPKIENDLDSAFNEYVKLTNFFLKRVYGEEANQFVKGEK
jgi:hypothetical protein